MGKQTIEQYRRIQVQDIQWSLGGVDPRLCTKENPLSIFLSASLFPVQLVATPCNYGWYRWWFVCPKTFKKCLYLYFSPSDGMYYSREVLSLSYASQNESRIGRIVWWMYREREIAKLLSSKIHKMYVKGVPTRKYAQIIKLKERRLCQSLKEYLPVIERTNNRLQRKYITLTGESLV